ncbi:RNA-binding protein [Fumia xinanensis]|uniref:RNA-binding protein n=1 Tax=Fumia xinanensis TaxID=2763659 RepID=A0A926E3I1_9FIRM|nr:YlmH/Sll1252 family protein [Fumia xinanensis]MBC8558536.1 RNA-binding protein [Fumia xinanensis]
MDKEQKEREYFLAGIRNLIELSMRQDAMKFSSFLNEQQQAMAEPIVRKSGAQYRFYGGFPGAQRQMLGVFPDHMEPLDDYFPLKAFTFRYPDNYHLSHRDFLGTLMAQQIKRETIGDIVITSGKAFLFAEERVQKLVATQIDKVGGVGVTVEQGVDGPVTAVQKFRELKGTLASLRLDASVSLVTGLSREKAAKLITSGMVTLNYLDKSQGASLLKEGDILTVRGYGKFRLTTVGHETRKGRISVLFDAFVNE